MYLPSEVGVKKKFESSDVKFTIELLPNNSKNHNSFSTNNVITERLVKLTETKVNNNKRNSYFNFS